MPHAIADDLSRFSDVALARVRAAADEIEWLLGRGYPLAPAIAFVGGRHQLDERQRRAIERSVAAHDAIARRLERALAPSEVRGRTIAIDGFNVIVTIEVACVGGLLLRGRDGALRDLAGVRGSYRVGDATERAIALLGATIAELAPASATLWLDAPVSHSAELARAIRQAAPSFGTALEVELARDVDRRVAEAPIAASSDARIIDSAPRWIPLSRWIVEEHVPDAFVVDLSR